MKITRMKYKDLGTNPENGKHRRLFVGYMTEAEYVAAIMGANVADDLDDGAELDPGDVQPDLWDELQQRLETPEADGYGQD